MDGTTERLTIDQLYERKVDADQAAHLARRAYSKHPDSVALRAAFEAAEREAEAAHTVYLDGLIAEQAELASVG
jgi:hypothetical protein